MSIFFDNYHYEDEQHVINRFKELINPSNEKSYSAREYNNEFIAITRYLGEAGYQIKQFPNILVHPTFKKILLVTKYGAIFKLEEMKWVL